MAGSNDDLARRFGWLGLPGAAGLWVLSLCALGLAMNSNMAAANSARVLPLHNAAPLVVHLHEGAVFFAVGCSLLQIAAGLLMAFTLRAAYQLRAAACYALAIATVLGGNVLALGGLLVWIHMHDGL